MNLFDTNRPKLTNDRPLVLGQQFTVPDFVVQPLPENKCRVSIMLPGQGTGFCWHNAIIPMDALSALLVSYAEDPELYFELVFQWKPTNRVILDPHFSTRAEREAAEPQGSSSAPRTRSAPAAPPPGFALPDLSNIDF